MKAHVEIDVYEIISNLSDADRLEWITDLLETIQKPGTIDVIRSTVNSDSYDD